METSFLYPRESCTRQVKDLSGLWEFQMDKAHTGRQNGWENGLPHSIPMAVPSSFNDIFTDKDSRDFVGDLWYETSFFLPQEWSEKDVFLRFGSATHQADVWVNGLHVGSHTGGFMPFLCRLNDAAVFGGRNRVVVAVNNELSYTTIPCGTVKTMPDGKKQLTPFFDFFNYAGLNRPVWLMALPAKTITDITVIPSIEGKDGVLSYHIQAAGQEISVELLDHTRKVVCRADGAVGTLKVKNAILWHPDHPYLYTLSVKLSDNNILLDEYELETGIRTISVSGNRILLNGAPIYLKGFGKHEDSAYRGRGYDPAVLLRDMELLKWIGANSVRTSHYPYAEEFYQMADRYGILVIDEVPAVGMFDMMNNFLGAGTGQKTKFFEREEVHTETLEAHKDVIRETFVRDKNHPCVIMWSLANEPDTTMERSGEYFKKIFDYARTLDQQHRPMGFASIGSAPWGTCNAHSNADVIFLNRYYGWYSQGGPDLPYAKEVFEKELRGWSSTGKPIVMTEYGADTMPGVHKLPSVMWSEEYQMEYLRVQHEVFDACDSLVGELMWNFADFQTTEGIFRVNGNKKGIFTRDRQPKSAAYLIKERWEHFAIK